MSDPRQRSAGGGDPDGSAGGAGGKAPRGIDPRFARDVARELDRRRMRRRAVVWTALVGAIVAAAMYATCGHGFGIGGRGEGPGPGPGSAHRITGPARCALRVSAAGITVDGKPATRDDAVTRCRAAEGADVIVTGDAREGDWKELRAALEAARVDVFVREPRARP